MGINLPRAVKFVVILLIKEYSDKRSTRGWPSYIIVKIRESSFQSWNITFCILLEAVLVVLSAFSVQVRCFEQATLQFYTFKALFFNFSAVY